MSYRARPQVRAIETRALALFRRFDTLVGTRALVPMFLVAMLDPRVGITVVVILLFRAIGHMHFGFQVVGITTVDCLKHAVRCFTKKGIGRPKRPNR